MSGSTADREGYLVAGDGLRALAALMVLGFHAFVGVVVLLGPRVQGYDFGAVGDLLVRGNAGLYVFFVLSGYLVGGPWVRAWLRGGGYPRPLAYLGRRARRIVPAFWVVTVALLLWHGPAGANGGDVLALLAFGQVFLPVERTYVLQQGWTLDVEAMFYVALPVLGLLAARVRLAPALRLPVLLAALGGIFATTLALRAGPGEGDGAGVRTLLTFAWAFVPGLVLAALEPTARARLAGRAARGRAIAWALGAVGVGSVLVLALFDLDDGRLPTLLAYAGTGGGLVGGALVWQWATGRAPAGLDTRAAHALGRWSYGIYLLHVGVGLELTQRVPGALGPAGVLAWVLGGMLVVSTALAAALWWLVEQPILTGRRPALALRRADPVERPTGPPATAVPPAAK